METRGWWQDVPISRSVQIPPEPRFLDSIGHNYDFETAIADLVDNSVDAGARTVLARFITTSGSVTGFALVDDGRGISPEQIETAMTLGGDNDYRADSLGYFGVGLKASSFSQANTLSLFSRDSLGREAGMRWVAEKATTGFEYDVIDTEYARKILSRSWGAVGLSSGTVVLWTDMKSFPTTTDPKIVEPFLQSATDRLVGHLGLVFHRIIADGLTILVDVEEATTGETGPETTVVAVDPFGHVRSGANGYPKTLIADYHGRSLNLRCYIWPGRSHTAEFKLDGKGGADAHQGFYFYRNDRLLQVGGWNGVFAADREHQLARAVIDIDSSQARYLRMNPEKSSVTTDAEFQVAVGKARAEDGETFWGYLDDAQDIYKRSRARSRQRPKTVAPGKGFHPALRRVLDDELEYLPDEDPFDIRWKPIPGDTFLEVDRTNRALLLNKRYRQTLTGSDHGSLNDAPVLKSLLYLLMQDVFKGSYLGPRDKDCIDLWQQVLTAAAHLESE